MRGSVSAELVAELARIAGFALRLERCELLAPQLEWMLGEAARIDELPGEEPIGVFRPSETVQHKPAEEGSQHG